jgi:Co/Zn/Cd efflux system component
MGTNDLLIIIALLLAAILITLLGGWGVIGVVVAIVFTLFIVSWLRKSISEAVSKAIRSSAPYRLFANRRRMKELKKTIKRKSKLGYETSEYEEELAFLKNNKLSKEKFKSNA